MLRTASLSRNIDWNNIYSAAQIYCTDYNFTVGTSNYYVGAGYFRDMHLMHSPYISSDARLKENIQPIESALDKLMLVNGKSFNYINDFGDDFKITPLRERNSRPTYGFIAQEMKEVLPEIVSEPDSLNEYYSVDYIAMIPLLVEAIKEQQNQIAELQEQIANMEQIEIEEKSTRSHNDENGNEALEPNAVLYQNSPNPFYTETTIRFYIPIYAGKASLLVFDMQGTLKKQMPIPISLALTAPIPDISSSLVGSSSIILKVSAPNLATILAAVDGPIPLMAPEERYLSMESSSSGSDISKLSALN